MVLGGWKKGVGGWIYSKGLRLSGRFALCGVEGWLQQTKRLIESEQKRGQGAIDNEREMWTF